jgi:hypothetical protein
MRGLCGECCIQPPHNSSAAEGSNCAIYAQVKHTAGWSGSRPVIQQTVHPILPTAAPTHPPTHHVI